jgi:hypothetical protein
MQSRGFHGLTRHNLIICIHRDGHSPQAWATSDLSSLSYADFIGYKYFIWIYILGKYSFYLYLGVS